MKKTIGDTINNKLDEIAKEKKLNDEGIVYTDLLLNKWIWFPYKLMDTALNMQLPLYDI